ncbi:MAG TPA: deoxyguanosinetriphosphate triphosphohydrolase, partial [Bellilinea sp.]|nr:deoxyguanosinetriphosphate triphosphohydrolase [Bellilinea sp.]
ADAADYNPELRGHMEAQIANVADELAYTAHDLDDGLRSGMLTVDMLDGIELWQIMRERIGWRGNLLDDLTRHRIIRKLIGAEMDDLVETSNNLLTTSKVASVEELQSLPYNVIRFSEKMVERNRQLKDFLYSKLYRHYRVVRMAEKAEQIISNLFNAYIETPATMPNHVQSRIPEIGLERTVCDYIAGMTDRFAVEETRKLFDPEALT